MILKQEVMPAFLISGQIEQVLINLATNARDAMPDGGVLTVKTAVVSSKSESIKGHVNSDVRKYGLISVSDSGIGMDEKTKEKIFDPFFTTKEVGKGTGLGLAMVYGIVQQHEGYITVDSKKGKGACFTIYLPLIEVCMI
jgi:signal transduction histidine kinase